MNGPIRRLVGEGNEYNEQHKRCGNEPVGVACIIDIFEVNDTRFVDLINKLRVKVSRDNGDARFKIHDMAYRWARGTKGFNEGDGSCRKK